MQYITELRQSLSDTAISRELGLSLSGVQHYTQGRAKKPNPRILDYVNSRIERYKRAFAPGLGAMINSRDIEEMLSIIPSKEARVKVIEKEREKREHDGYDKGYKEGFKKGILFNKRYGKGKSKKY